MFVLHFITACLASIYYYFSCVFAFEQSKGRSTALSRAESHSSKNKASQLIAERHKKSNIVTAYDGLSVARHKNNFCPRTRI
jgi:hypothetical protein